MLHWFLMGYCPEGPRLASGFWGVKRGLSFSSLGPSGLFKGHWQHLLQPWRRGRRSGVPLRGPGRLGRRNFGRTRGAGAGGGTAAPEASGRNPIFLLLGWCGFARTTRVSATACSNVAQSAVQVVKLLGGAGGV